MTDDIIFPKTALPQENSVSAGEWIAENPGKTGGIAAAGTLLFGATKVPYAPVKVGAYTILAALAGTGVYTTVSTGAKNAKYENIALNATMGYALQHAALKTPGGTEIMQNNDAGYVQHVMIRARDPQGRQLLQKREGGEPTVKIYLAEANSTVRPDGSHPEVFLHNSQNQPIIIDSGLTEAQFQEKESEARQLRERLKADFDKNPVLTRGIQGTSGAATAQQPISVPTNDPVGDLMTWVTKKLPIIAPVVGIGAGLLSMAIGNFSGASLLLGALAIGGGLFYKQIGNGIAAVQETAPQASNTPKAEEKKTADTTTEPAKVASIAAPAYEASMPEKAPFTPPQPKPTPNIGTGQLLT